MPLITGNLDDVTGVPIPLTQSPRIKFQLSTPTTVGLYVYVSAPRYAIPGADGSFSINLLSTDSMRPAGVFYRVSIEWLDPGGNYTSLDYLTGNLYLHSTGGNIGDLILSSIRPDQSWVSPGAVVPDAAVSNDWLFDPTTDNFYRVH